MSKDWYNDIVEFHKTFDHHIGEKPEAPPYRTQDLRMRLIEEEMTETIDAINDGDLEEIADGIADSIVVLLGTAISYGIDIRPIWDEVHRSNMAKVGGGKNEFGKSLKPENWKAPRIAELLKQQGAVLD